MLLKITITSLKAAKYIDEDNNEYYQQLQWLCRNIVWLCYEISNNHNAVAAAAAAAAAATVAVAAAVAAAADDDDDDEDEEEQN